MKMRPGPAARLLLLPTGEVAPVHQQRIGAAVLATLDASYYAQPVLLIQAQALRPRAAGDGERDGQSVNPHVPKLSGTFQVKSMPPTAR